MKMQTIRLPSDNALRCRALAQENAALRAAAARWAKARRLALAVNGTIGAVGVGLVVGSGLPAALCLTPWDWPLTLAGAVLAGAACVVECASAWSGWPPPSLRGCRRRPPRGWTGTAGRRPTRT